MTIQDLKMDALKEGFEIIERGNVTPEGDFIVESRIEKYDTDGMMWYATFILGHWAYGTVAHTEILKISIERLMDYYWSRQEKNINTCNHADLTIIGAKRLCTNCKVKLKDHVPINLKNVN